jgi:chromate transport protein ChrA
VTQLPPLIWVFAYLSLLTVGGGLAAFPELEYLTVSVYKWLNSTQLIHLYSLGQVAPGPNMMMVAAIGERVAGLRRAGRPVRLRRPLTRESRACAWASRRITAVFT